MWEAPRKRLRRLNELYVDVALLSADQLHPAGTATRELRTTSLSPRGRHRSLELESSSSPSGTHCGRPKLRTGAVPKQIQVLHLLDALLHDANAAAQASAATPTTA
jgi:hypothetical protein